MTWPTSTPPAWMRDASRRALPDTCIVTRVSDEATLDVVTGDLDPGEAEVIYEGPCRVRPRGSQEQSQLIGDLHETLAPYAGTLPATADAAGVTAGDPNEVRTDDYLRLTASSDPGMVDRAFQVKHTGWSSWQIDRRLGLEDREQSRGIEVAS